MRTNSRFTLPVLFLLAITPPVESQQPVDIAVGPIAVEADSAGVLRAAADSCLVLLIGGLKFNGISVTRVPSLTETNLAAARPAPWALLGKVIIVNGKPTAVLSIYDVASGHMRRGYQMLTRNAGYDVRDWLDRMDRLNLDISAFIQEQRRNGRQTGGATPATLFSDSALMQ